MFEVSVDETFAAGHALRGYKGKCENVHGHNYRVRVTLQGDSLDSIGLLYDFVHLKRIMKDVIQVLDHRFMNEIPPFDTVNPSAENIANYRITAEPGGAVLPISAAALDVDERTLLS